MGAKKKQIRSFDPATVLVCMEQATLRDLSTLKHVYSVDQRALSFLTDTWVRSFRKKFVPVGCDQTPLEEKTFQKFLDVNSHMAEYSDIPWPGVDALQSSTPYFDRVLLRMRSLARFVLTDFSLDEFYSAARHGQGSTVGVPFVDTSIERKFSYPISVTKRAKPLFEDLLRWDVRLNDSISLLNANSLGSRFEEVRGSRATTVEKTSSIRRMIAVEPTANMYMQQGLMTMMYKRLRAVGLDVGSLPGAHTRRAYESSITGREATIDFSSASDCVSTGLLRWLLPPKWFRYLDAVRSPEMSLKGDWVSLNMFSTMGNAGTFPLETLVFWTIALACDARNYSSINALLPEIGAFKSVSVFGDDCILPSDTAGPFMWVAESLGFIVNKEKSFYGDEGFRESCGGDYYHGIDVRPLYIEAPRSLKRSDLESWLYIVGNGVLKKYISYFGSLTYVYQQGFWSYYFSLFRRHGISVKIVPDDYPEDSGLRLFQDVGRFVETYDINLSKITISHHGTVSFSYNRFVYREKESNFDTLRYAYGLGHGIFTPSDFWSVFCDGLRRTRPAGEQVFERKTRKVGGYVVANGTSCFIDVNLLRRQLRGRKG
jgi:hypothetical protein